MARKLAATVHVLHGGQRHSLLAGTSPADELAALVTNEAAWEPAGDESGGTTEPADTSAPAPEPEPPADADPADADPADEPEPSSRPRAKRRQG